MSAEINEEIVNDTAKLAMHRLIVRAIRRDPRVIGDAKTALAKMEERFPNHDFIAEWRSILELPAAEIYTLLTRRSEEMFRLRLSSPFVTIKSSVDLTNVKMRRRIWKIARRIAIRSEHETRVADALHGKCYVSASSPSGE